MQRHVAGLVHMVEVPESQQPLGHDVSCICVKTTHPAWRIATYWVKQKYYETHKQQASYLSCSPIVHTAFLHKYKVWYSLALVLSKYVHHMLCECWEPSNRSYEIPVFDAKSLQSCMNLKTDQHAKALISLVFDRTQGTLMLFWYPQ